MKIYNTLSREKEEFISIHPNRVGMYVCGPTVYGDPHLGHARPSITFDVLFRYLQYKGYAVRYVRNITDVGHLENDADDGNDKIAQKARLEKLEPMEIAQHYTNRYNDAMRQLNVLPPSIEPRASGHIIEQIELIKTIIAKGFAYESKGSIYFDVETYHKQFPYGQLSGRVLEDQQAANRALDGQSEKRKSYDFALWKNAKPEHIMRWPSPWSEGFPGWHLECSAMSAKYLGAQFDIHGGGMDLMFPHHECEIAQSTAAQGKPSVKYWMHNNMITIDGQKMGKSLGNFIILEDLFAGKHPKLEQAYSPMCIRFFILQAHYRGTLDFSNAALQASEKGLQRLLNACELLPSIQPSQQSTVLVSELIANCYAALDDDLNTPIAIAHLFDAVRMINNLHEGREQITATDLASLVELFQNVVFDILGLQSDKEAKGNKSLTDGLIQFILNLRLQAKSKKDFGTSDAIRDEMNRLGVVVKDTKDGFEFTY